jgi:phospholipid/cholesterol/gamma-HCH transport system substrate-binding protein
MKRDNINYLVVGLFVIAITAALFVVLYKITGRTGPTEHYFVTYENVTGIQYGTPVSYEGFQVGQVEDIKPVRAEGSTRYRLELAIIQGWQIPADSIARIIASGLLAEITIDIQEVESTDLLAPGDEIQGREAANIFAAVNEVAADIQDLSHNSLKPFLGNLNAQIDLLTADFHDLTNNSIRPMIDKISKQVEQPELFDELQTLLAKLNDSADRLNDVFGNENQENLNLFLGNMKTASGNLNNLLGRLDDTRTEMDALLTNIDVLVNDLDQLLDTNDADIKASISHMQKTLFTISKHINAVSHHLEGSSRNIHEFTRQIKENPGVLLRSSPQIDEGSQE